MDGPIHLDGVEWEGGEKLEPHNLHTGIYTLLMYMYICNVGISGGVKIIVYIGSTFTAITVCTDTMYVQ